MLVLTRKVNEALIIGGKIRVVVAAIQNTKVRLGVEAPPVVAVDREEIHLLKLHQPGGRPRYSPSRSTTC